MPRTRLRPAFLVTLSLGASACGPPPAPAHPLKPLPSNGVIDTSQFTETFSDDFLCGPGHPLFTNHDRSECLCYGLGNPPGPPQLYECPKK
jgi:hypothetical protein